MAEAPKLRSVDFLSPEQLQRKRETDRKSQRQLRERTKQHIHILERRVRELETRNQTLEQNLLCLRAQCQCRHVQLPQPQQWQPPAAIPTSVTDQIPGSYDDNSADQNSIIAPSESWHDCLDSEVAQMLDRGGVSSAPALWTRVIDDTIVSMSHPFDELADVNYANAYTANEAQTSTLSVTPVWSAIPNHSHPTCHVDRVLVNLLKSRRAQELMGGNILEFQKSSFPSIQSLLNPTHNSRRSPVTATIVKSIIRFTAVPTLPEQIAILYVMSSIVRWQISPTESNYDSIPEWLRPTPSQITTSHPPWVDLFLFPKARERLCRHKKYHDQHPVISHITNDTLSINWPYEASDMTMQVNETDTILNPIFERHIRDLKNWTMGKRFLDVFPEFKNEINLHHLNSSKTQ